MRKGAGFMMVAVITAIMVALTSLGVTKVNQAAFGGYNTSRVMLQAQQYAEAEAAVVKATAYDDLTARSKVEIQNSNGYYSEITLSNESDYAENVKQRIATINIYKDNEVLPRFKLNVVKTDAEVGASGGGVPVGTIIAWASTTAPTEGGTWLLCNGQSCAAYPKLVALIGNTVPSLNGRFLEGTTGTPRTTKSAGLPNITGGAQTGAEYWTENGSYNSGALTATGVEYGTRNRQGEATKYRTRISIDASKSNSIYGASTTVQPPSYLVRYYIKAA